MAGVAAGRLILIAVSGLPLWAFNIVTAVVFALLVPFAAAAITLLYGDRVASLDERTDNTGS